MTNARQQFRQALADGDFRLLRAAHRQLWPKLPPPKDDAEAEIIMHLTRTQSDWLPFNKRAWSHCWLRERALPSNLPDRLRPSAEQLFQKPSQAVGISVNARSPLVAPAVPYIRGAMEKAVLEAEADGKLADSGFVKSRMKAAKDKALDELFGRINFNGG